MPGKENESVNIEGQVEEKIDQEIDLGGDKAELNQNQDEVLAGNKDDKITEVLAKGEEKKLDENASHKRGLIKIDLSLTNFPSNKFEELKNPLVATTKGRYPSIRLKSCLEKNSINKMGKRKAEISLSHSDTVKPFKSRYSF